jgi:hypothetical protein
MPARLELSPGVSVEMLQNLYGWNLKRIPTAFAPGNSECPPSLFGELHNVFVFMTILIAETES